ncbi:M20/M25/M40 family metallo-hydrolase [Sphaerobacter sp.]|uniref:M20/M25/M40 family metallo-hydrolase n=1 Tax=Sphaerobacter sp. TaxID=2099654 RepID=UPI001D9310B8|nr:M20/M25/M40 family metallo-hydrolase [Sphaerobacter sp.]MBX5445078.1 M20/M25/M40 family metallo-hydrolase [Sphaerobacter sp.]
MTDLSPVYAYVDTHADRMIADLQRLIRQPSISSANIGVRECAELLVEMMGDVGITARVIETDGLPVVYGEITGDRPDAPTLLIYTHYDVQPADPESDWESPPFEARRVGDRIIGRGTTDAKGNLMAHLKAVEALRATTGMPINIKFIFDGEEESGSPSLPAFVERHRDLLAADAALSFDGGFDAGDVPRVSLGTSGLLFVQMRARGGSKDLHSARARLVPNPAWKLVWALASIKGPDGRVRIEGFYDAVRPPTPLERSLLEQAGWDDEAQKRDLGVDEFLGGVSGVDALEQLLFTPTCNIAGFASGYVGEGNKTLLPATAAVNVDFRLVADQDPADIFQRLRKHLDDHGFADVELHDLGSIEPSRVPADSPFARVVVEAARRVYGREPSLRPSESASGRQAVWLAGKLGIPGAGTGIGPPDWRGHAANEFITVHHYLAGIKYAATIWSLFGEG